MDRTNYPVRWSTLEAQGSESDVDRLSAEERLAMIWPLTVQAWMFKEGWVDERRLRRDVIRLTVLEAKDPPAEG